MSAGHAAPEGIFGRVPRARRAFLAALLLLAATAGPGAATEAPPEPEGYRMDAFRAPTPQTLKGAKVLSTAEAEALWRARSAVFVDVLPRPPRPAGLPSDTLWREVPHNSIPDAVWLVNTGFGALSPESEAYFRDGLKAVTGNDPERPVVLFCQRACWMSWNAAKRALAQGYAHVLWYPDGTDGWTEAGLPLARAEPW